LKINPLKHFYLYIVFLLFNSCHYFETASAIGKELLQKGIKGNQLEGVDEYPSFVDCDKLGDKPARQNCFLSSNPTYSRKTKCRYVASTLPELDTIEVK
jgi:hypothetical protein